MAFVDFHGINIATIVNFKPLVLHQQFYKTENVTVGINEPVEAGCDKLCCVYV
jgi:hypothetical protein